MTQRWKTDKNLYACPTKKNGLQINKELDYDTTYRKEFLNCDPLCDWPSIDRCKWLWEWAMRFLGDREGVICDFIESRAMNWSVLDVGTKDCQFPEWLREQSIMAIGLEYAEDYVRYAIEKGRPVKYGNACDMEFDDGVFDFVFSHHLHGLLPDYAKGLEEMLRVSNKYMLCLNQVPGNKKKHYSYIDSPQIYYNFIEFGQHTVGPFEVLYNDYLDTGQSDEWVFFVKKLEYEEIGVSEMTEIKEDTDEMILEEIENEAKIEFKKKI